MERRQIEELIEKYRRMSTQEYKYGEEKCAFYNRVAGQIEDSIEDYLDKRFETETEILDDVKETFMEVDDYCDFEE